jgi:elongation factor P
MSKISTSNFQKGIFIQYRDMPHQIVEFTFVNPGKGSAFVRTKLKSVTTGKVQEFTFKSGETVEEVPINVREAQYLYKENEKFVFMDKFTYEQYYLTKEILGNFYKFIKEGEEYQVLVLDGQGVGIRRPKKVKLKVTDADEAVRGNTVMGAKKTVILETEAQIIVPLFIKKDDYIYVDPEGEEYLERASQSMK